MLGDCSVPVSASVPMTLCHNLMKFSVLIELKWILHYRIVQQWKFTDLEWANLVVNDWNVISLRTVKTANSRPSLWKCCGWFAFDSALPVPILRVQIFCQVRRLKTLPLKNRFKKVLKRKMRRFLRKQNFQSDENFALPWKTISSISAFQRRKWIAENDSTNSNLSVFY